MFRLNEFKTTALRTYSTVFPPKLYNHEIKYLVSSLRSGNEPTQQLREALQRFLAPNVHLQVHGRWSQTEDQGRWLNEFHHLINYDATLTPSTSTSGISEQEHRAALQVLAAIGPTVLGQLRLRLQQRREAHASQTHQILSTTRQAPHVAKQFIESKVSNLWAPAPVAAPAPAPAVDRAAEIRRVSQALVESSVAAAIEQVIAIKNPS